MKNAVCVLLVLLMAGPARAATLYVGPPADYTNEIKAGRLKSSIQAAIDAAFDGDTIVVEEGTYFENINFEGKSITLRSTEPNNPDIVASTIIDGTGNGSVVTINSGEDANCVLSGFTITNGIARFGGGINIDGGRLSLETSPTIRNCIVTGNYADEGGGIFCFMSLSIITNCTINSNSAAYGGGVGCVCTRPTLINCSINKNSASWHGGGMYGDVDFSTSFNCTFNENYSEKKGGGVYVWESESAWVNCIFSGNRTNGLGGGFYNGSSSIGLTNCTFSGNSSDEGGGIYSGDQSGLTNCILWGDVPNEITANFVYPTSVIYSDIQGGWQGEGNIDVEPCFANAGRWDDDVWRDGDYHLKSQTGRWDANEGRWTIDEVTSPCIDTGDSMSPIGYEPFPNGGIINMGAYGGTAEASKSYFGEPPCEIIVAGDINGDCAVNFLDFRLMALHWLTNNNP